MSWGAVVEAKQKRLRRYPSLHVRSHSISCWEPAAIYANARPGTFLWMGMWYIPVTLVITPPVAGQFTRMRENNFTHI